MIDRCKILALGNFSEYQYHPFGEVAEILSAVLPSERFEIRCTEERRQLNGKNSAPYDVILSYVDSSRSRLAEDLMEDLRQFVARGKGLVGVHCGISYENSHYRDFFGATFTQHPPYQKIAYEIKDKAHPVTGGLSSFELEDELYMFEFFPGHKLDILLEGVWEGKKYPAAWAKKYQDGRIVYLAPGHTAETFRHPTFARILANSLLWAAGRKLSVNSSQ